MPEPKVPPDSVLVRVRAAGVNPVDWKMREGRLEGAFPHVFPVVPGWDAAGVVERVGPGVTEFAPGDEVFAYCRKHFVGEGTYAELVSVPVTSVAAKPKSVDFVQAAGIPLAALTAYQALFMSAAVTAGETVLVHAAAGGVGSFAVQLAADADCEVVGTASSANHEYVLGLGATEVIDYTEGDFVEAVRRAYPDGVDAALDFVGGDVAERSKDVLKDRSRVVSVIQPSPNWRYVFVRPDGEQLGELAQLVDEERLTVHVSETLPLEEAARAHELIESGHTRGKIVLRID